MRTELEVALLEKTLPPAKVKELLQSNLEEVKRLEALSDSLLRLARRSDEVEEWEPVEVNKAVEVAIAATKHPPKRPR